MNPELGTLIYSKKLGVDIWLIADPAFKPTDGLALYYHDEIPILKTKNLKELEDIQRVKLIFPGSKVVDPDFPRMPNLPWITKFTEEEIGALKEWFFKKYPKENRSYFDKPARACGPIGEFTFNAFLEAWATRYTWRSNNMGRDDLDFEIGDWKIDVKTQTSPFDYADNFRLHVIDKQLKSKHSIVNTYQWAHWNPRTMECRLMGWRLREDLYDVQAQKATDLPIFRKALTPVTDFFVPEEDGWEIRVEEAKAEALYLLPYPGKVK